MNINEFVEKYKIENDKEKFIKAHITKKYVPYIVKIEECKNIIKQSSFKTVNNKEIYFKDTPLQYLLFICSTIRLYTDIELGETVLEAYDLLNESGILKDIILKINSVDYEEFKTVLQMVDTDNYENYGSITSCVESKMEALSMLFENMQEVFNKLPLFESSGEKDD